MRLRNGRMTIIIIPKEETSAIKKNINIKSGSDILIDGKVNILTHLAKCCNPVKGDEIVGVITKNDGISVHQKNCENIINSENDFSIIQNVA